MMRRSSATRVTSVTLGTTGVGSDLYLTLREWRERRQVFAMAFTAPQGTRTQEETTVNRTIRTAALAAAIAGLALGASACAKRQTTSIDQTIGGPAGSVPQPGVAVRSLPGTATAPGAAARMPGAALEPATPAGTTIRGATTPERGTTSQLFDIFFSFDESTLSADARRVLDQNAAYLRQNPGLRVQVEGHADERGSTAYNLALGDRRAASARHYLESLGVEPSRVSTISYGEEKPFTTGSTDEAWAENRRDHFVELR